MDLTTIGEDSNDTTTDTNNNNNNTGPSTITITDTHTDKAQSCNSFHTWRDPAGNTNAGKRQRTSSDEKLQDIQKQYKSLVTQLQNLMLESGSHSTKSTQTEITSMGTHPDPLSPPDFRRQ